MTDMWSERDHTIMSLWHDVANNKEYMTRDGKYYVADASLVDNCLMQQRTIESLEDENQKLRELAGDLAHDYFRRGYRINIKDMGLRHTCAEYDELLRKFGIEVS